MSKVFVIAQGGGPTAVINQTLVGAVMAARKRNSGAKVLGAIHGVRGVAAGKFIDLSSTSEAELMRLANTPNSALGSTRDKPDQAYCARVLEGLKQVGANAFIYIGGNDTAGTQQILHDASGGSIAFIHAPKTIDNDLAENDHTPGFISAGYFVAEAFLSVGLDFRALPGIYVGIVMGRNAGFLTAASAAYRRDAEEAPHLVYVPEVPFSIDRFVNEIGAVYDRHGFCVAAMSEGVTDGSGKPLAEVLAAEGSLERDAHGNVQLSGGDLGISLQNRLKSAFPKGRSRVDTFGYLPRGFIGAISETDRREAFDVGAFAVEASEKGSGSVALQFADGKTRIALVDLKDVAAKTRHMPAEFIDAEKSHVTDACMAYLARLLPPRPDVVKLPF